jgi:hypothetical protein
MMTYIEGITQLIASAQKPPKKRKPLSKKSHAIKELEAMAYIEHYRNSSLPEQYRSRFKFNDSTANGLTKAIIAYIKICGGSAFRVNTQGQFDAKMNKWRHSGTRKGLPDVQGVMKGKYLGIEVKIGKDVQSEHQKRIESELIASGGLYFIAKDFESFRFWFDDTFNL